MTKRFLVLIGGGKKSDSPSDMIVRRLQLKKRWGSFFAKARIRSGLSREDLDSRLGLPSGTYGAWEQGFCLPAPKSLGRIMDSFDSFTNLEFQLLFNQLQQEAQVLRSENPQIG